MEHAVLHLQRAAGAVVVAGRAGGLAAGSVRHGALRHAVGEGDVLQRETGGGHAVVAAGPVEDADLAAAVDGHSAAAVDDGVLRRRQLDGGRHRDGRRRAATREGDDAPLRERRFQRGLRARGSRAGADHGVGLARVDRRDDPCARTGRRRRRDAPIGVTRRRTSFAAAVAAASAAPVGAAASTARFRPAATSAATVPRAAGRRVGAALAAVGRVVGGIVGRAASGGGDTKNETQARDVMHAAQLIGMFTPRVSPATSDRRDVVGQVLVAAAAAVLEHEAESAGGADAGDGRWRDHVHLRLGDLREGDVQLLDEGVGLQPAAGGVSMASLTGGGGKAGIPSSSEAPVAGAAASSGAASARPAVPARTPKARSGASYRDLQAPERGNQRSRPAALLIQTVAPMRVA